MVRLDGVVALLGRYPALAGVDLEVAQGEVVLVEGPNGAGKSTLLRLCAGLQRVESGSAEVLGCDLVRDRAMVRARVGLLGHENALYRDLTVSENLDLWVRAARLSPGEGRAALARLELPQVLHGLAVRRLSAGQRRRVALAALLLRRPEIWLLDEPHAGLDQAARRLVDELIGEAAAAGATVLMASHELNHAATTASRRVTLVAGMVSCAG